MSSHEFRKAGLRRTRVRFFSYRAELRHSCGHLVDAVSNARYCVATFPRGETIQQTLQRSRSLSTAEWAGELFARADDAASTEPQLFDCGVNEYCGTYGLGRGCFNGAAAFRLRSA